MSSRAPPTPIKRAWPAGSSGYLDECGRHGGKPRTGPALERFLPWNASPDDLRTPGAATATARRVNPRTDNAHSGIGHHELSYRLPGVLSHDFRILNRLRVPWR